MLKNLRSNQILSSNVRVASSFWNRLIGLMGTKSLAATDCLWIHNCNSVHTHFMKFDIDVIFLDEDLRVVKIIEALRPWRITMPVAKARSVVEFSSQKISDRLEVGDQVYVGN